MIRILVNSYNQLVTKDPYYDEEKAWGDKTAINEACRISAKPRKILGASTDQIIAGTADPTLLPDKFLIDLYTDLRQIEVGSPLSPLRLRTLKQEAYEHYMGRPQRALNNRQNAALRVNKLFRQYIYTKGAVAMQVLNLKRLDTAVEDDILSVEVAEDSGDIYD